MNDPDDVDAVKRRRLKGDDNAVRINAYQAQKCAAILEAYIDGQTLYFEYVNSVAQFLKISALETLLGKDNIHPSAQSIWAHLDDISWPHHGGAQPQAE